MAQQTVIATGAFIEDTKDRINDNFAELYATGSGTGDVVGPASVTANKVALFNGTTGKLIKADAGGVSAGPFTTITSITVVDGLVTALTGS